SREAMQRMYEGGSDDEIDEEFEWDGNEDDDFEGGEDEDDDVDNYENEYLQHLASKASKALGGNTDLENSLGSDDDEDDEYDEDLDEDYSLDTPLDHIDAYLVLQDRLTEMQAHNTGTYNAIMQSLSAENGQFLQHPLSESEQCDMPKKKWDDEESDGDDSIPDEWDASDAEESEDDKEAAKPEAAAKPQPTKKKTPEERWAERQAERQAAKAQMMAAGGFDEGESEDDGESKKMRERKLQLESDANNVDDLFAGLTVKD
ncbi:hypothetical protein GGI06_006179, partial [Coemansia sp. S85]